MSIGRAHGPRRPRGWRSLWVVVALVVGVSSAEPVASAEPASTSTKATTGVTTRGPPVAGAVATGERANADRGRAVGETRAGVAGAGGARGASARPGRGAKTVAGRARAMTTGGRDRAAGLADEPPAREGSSPVINHDSFGSKLDPATFRSFDARLSEAAYADKRNVARVSPLRFFRSYAAAFYHDLRAVAARGVPGKVGYVVGDAHPENFGFQRVEGETRYVFNDLDDSGVGPVAIDALRYFTALRLALPNDKKAFDDALERYVKTVENPSHGVTVPHSLFPDWRRVEASKLGEYTRGESFVHGTGPEDLRPAPAEVVAEVRALAAAGGLRSGGRVLDVARRPREGGGSGGLRRYWVLVEDAGRRTILEFKEATTPAIEGLGGRRLDPDERLPLLKTQFWGSRDERDNYYVKLAGTRFLVRDKLRAKSLDTLSLGAGKRADVVGAQVSLLAGLHAAGWEGVSPGEVHHWLSKSSETMAKRWAGAYRDSLAAPP